jgi:hypothetical protein
MVSPNRTQSRKLALIRPEFHDALVFLLRSLLDGSHGVRRLDLAPALETVRSEDKDAINGQHGGKLLFLLVLPTPERACGALRLPAPFADRPKRVG